MADILVRDVSENLKRELSEEAKRAGRSISEEIKIQVRKGLNVTRSENSAKAASTLSQLRSAFAGFALSDEEHRELMSATDEARRKEAERRGSE
ncbi:MAG TPA: hypothetical protein VGC14_01440 [Rhizobium sp.]